MAKLLDRLTIKPTAEQYERAIEATEKAFKRNKSRMHVLYILRDKIMNETGEWELEDKGE